MKYLKTYQELCESKKSKKKGVKFYTKTPAPTIGFNLVGSTKKAKSPRQEATFLNI
jgi:hypothetical protein